MNKSTKIEWKDINELIPYEHNAKKHSKTQIKNLKKSFDKYGWQNPILIDENNVIICGHGRILGAREAGMTEAPCIVCKDLSEDEIRDYRHLDNLLSEGDYIQEEFDIDLPDLSDFDFSEIDLNIDIQAYFDEGYGTDFSLPDGEKSELCTMNFIVHEKQKETIEKALLSAKKMVFETFGNTNQNGNALYEVMRQWVEQKK